MEFTVAQLLSHICKKGTSLIPKQGSSKSKKRVKFFYHKGHPVFLQKKKEKKKTIIDKVALSPEPINVSSPLSMSQERAPSPSPYLVPKVPTHPIRDSRKGKGFVSDLTTYVDGIALYQGSEHKKLDQYLSHLPIEAYENQLEAICKGMGSDDVIRHHLYQVCDLVL